jgi:hypothetical protein
MWLLAFCLVAGTGCKKKVGSSCEKGEARCQDRTTELVCEDGKFVATTCKGPGGCVENRESVTCDIAGNQPDSPCSKVEEGAASCVEEHRMIACRGGRYRSVPCRGPKGCENEEGKALCDTSIAEPTDPCKDEGLKACSQDGKDVLGCQHGEMQGLYRCRGPGGCESKSGKLECDMSIVGLDDPCDKTMEGKNACSMDGKSIAVCRGGKFVVDEKCKPGTRCNTKGSSLECGKPVEDAGASP